MKPILLLLCLTTLNLPAFSQASDADKSLVGIDTMAVVVERLPEDVQKNGPTSGALKSRIEMRLKQSGIVVVPYAANLHRPFVYLAINGAKPEGSQAISFDINFSVCQAVRILRNSQAISAKTWERSTVGVVPKGELDGTLIRILSDFLDAFINTAQTGNPQLLGR